MKGKRFLSILLAIATMFLLATGCGRKAAVTEEDLSKVPETPYEIQWYLCASPQQDKELVEKALNDYLKDKINATVKLNFMETAQYSKKLTTIISAGEYFDLCWCADYMLSFPSNADIGAFYPLDEYLETSLKDIAELTPDILFDTIRSKDGHIYGLPVLKEFSQAQGWVYRKDIAEKYNIDMSKYKNYEELEPVLEMIKAKEPDMQYPVDWDTSSSPIAVGREGSSPVAGMIIEADGNNGYKIEYQPNNASWLEGCETARRFYEKGLIKKDILTSDDKYARASEGKTFALWEALKPGKAQELFAGSKFEWAQAGVTPNYIDMSPGMGSLQAISATSKNPARVARFLNLLNTDPYVKNLVLYGIEGKHYEKVSDDVVKVYENAKYNIANTSWQIGNVYLDYVKTTDDPNKISDLKKFSDSAVERPKYLMFKFDATGLEQYTSAVSAVKQEFNTQCTMGAMDYREPAKKYAKKLESVGGDELLKKIKEQFDEYMKTE